MKGLVLFLVVMVTISQGLNLPSNDDSKRSQAKDAPDDAAEGNRFLSSLIRGQKSIAQRGIIDRLTGDECAFYGQECSVTSLTFCCAHLQCKKEKWYHVSGRCRYEWE